MAQFHPSTRKNPLQSSARAVRCAKLCHRLTQCTGHKQFVFPQIFSSFPQNSTTSRKTQLPKGSHRRAEEREGFAIALFLNEHPTSRSLSCGCGCKCNREGRTAGSVPHGQPSQSGGRRPVRAFANHETDRPSGRLIKKGFLFVEGVPFCATVPPDLVGTAGSYSWHSGVVTPSVCN
jgi:hypothetical protein